MTRSKDMVMEMRNLRKWLILKSVSSAGMHIMHRLMVNYDTQDNIYILTGQIFWYSSLFGITWPSNFHLRQTNFATNLIWQSRIVIMCILYSAVVGVCISYFIMLPVIICCCILLLIFDAIWDVLSKFCYILWTHTSGEQYAVICTTWSRSGRIITTQNCLKSRYNKAY